MKGNEGAGGPTRAQALKYAILRLPGAVPVAQVIRRGLDPDRRHEMLLWAFRRKLFYQTGGRTSLDRYPDLFAALSAALEDFPDPSVLSFGCSTGEELVTLRRYLPAARLAGIDINRARIRAARRMIADPAIVLHAAPSIAATRSGPYDAICCLSVLHRRELVHDWPTDCRPHMTFEMFDAALHDFDAHLKPGGLLLIYHTAFRFIESDIATRYEPLLLAEPLVRTPAKRYDRNNQPVLEPVSERFALWRKLC